MFVCIMNVLYIVVHLVSVLQSVQGDAASCLQVSRCYNFCCFVIFCTPFVSCPVKIQNCFTFLMPVYVGCTGKEAIEWALLLLFLLLMMKMLLPLYRLDCQSKIG